MNTADILQNIGSIGGGEVMDGVMGGGVMENVMGSGMESSSLTQAFSDQGGNLAGEGGRGEERGAVEATSGRSGEKQQHIGYLEY